MHSTASVFGIGAICWTLASAQAPNNIQYTYPDERTQVNNGTWTIFPISRTIVQSALPSNYTLLDNLDTDPTVFPDGFPADMHPIMLGHVYQGQIKIDALEIPLSIPFLLNAEIYIPFIDVLGDGKTPFTYPVFGLIGGDNGQLLSNLLPALVATVSGNLVYPGEFDPDNISYLQNDPVNDPGVFTTSGSQTILDNPLSGPGITNPSYSITFSSSSTSPYTPHTFHSILNQPELLTDGQCIRNVQYFKSSDYDNLFANPFMTKASVRLFSGTLVSDLAGIPKGFEGVYEDAYGYAATSQTVGFSSEDCAISASKVDPRASL